MIVFSVLIIINALLLMLSALNAIKDLPIWQKVACGLDFIMIVVCVVAMLAKAGQI